METSHGTGLFPYVFLLSFFKKRKKIVSFLFCKSCMNFKRKENLWNKQTVQAPFQILELVLFYCVLTVGLLSGVQVVKAFCFYYSDH